jgi:hypothetical protein
MLLLVLFAQRPPPAIGALVGILSPALDHLLAVLGVIETVEHFGRHELLTSFQLAKGRLYGRDLAGEPVLF